MALAGPREKGRTARKEKTVASARRVTFGILAWLGVVILLANLANAGTATFEDLTLPGESYWNGADGSGGFQSGSAYFSNHYDVTWGSWDGFAYSNITDTAATGITSQYNAITGEGQAGSAYYALCYVGWVERPVITLDAPYVVEGLYVTNNNTTYYSMLNGDPFCKKFGGDDGSDPDWLLLTITGKDKDGRITGTVEFYLADLRFQDPAQDYILKTWRFVDLTSLGTVKCLDFSLSSSDTGAWGMNTPAYFAIDTIVLGPPFAEGGCYTEAGINGYIGDDRRHAAPTDDDAVINPMFRGWASSIVSYVPAPGVDALWADPNRALGPATGDNLDIVSLGDLNRSQIDSNEPPGQIMLGFDEVIRNSSGYDFVVFENGLISRLDTSGGSVAGQMFAELGYVEVSSNGQDFVRFPAVSLTRSSVGSYGTIEISDVYNLAGKHPNANGICTGTPFDLQEIADRPEIVSGIVDINNIRYVRLVDIPGSGDFYDEAVSHVQPGTGPDWDNYADTHPIYDAWVTWGSAGLDLEAIGVLKEQQYSADVNLDGVVDVSDFVLLASAWKSCLGRANWIARCDLAQPRDYVIDRADLAVFAGQWLGSEPWQSQ